MAKMSDYPSVENTDEFTQEQKEAFLGSAMCIATGSKTDGGSKVTANIPLSDIKPVVPTKLSDLTDDITVDTYDAASEAPISGKGVAAALGNIPAGGYTRVTRNATINNDEFVVPVNNRESVTAILTGGSNTTDTVKLEISNDCDDAIVFLDGSASYEGIAGVSCYRGNTQLRVILPIQRKLHDVDYLLQSTNESGSGRAVPSDWNEVGLVYASYAGRYEHEKLYPRDISADNASNLLVRIVADYAFVHYVDLPDN